MTDTEIRWVGPIKNIRQYIFEISTPGGYGTGFQIYYSKIKGFCAIATAYHVVQHAYEWGEPIKLTHYSSNDSLLLKDGERTFFVYPDKDLALVLFDKKDLKISEVNPKLVPPRLHVNEGVEIGWCGFPSNAPRGTLCFFEGFVSSYMESQDLYLIDGVSINGVSGGPTFHINATNETVMAGVINAYYPNLAVTGTPMPGLCSAVSIEPYQKKLQEYQSFDEAQEKAEQENAKVVSGLKVGPTK